MINLSLWSIVTIGSDTIAEAADFWRWGLVNLAKHSRALPGAMAGSRLGVQRPSRPQSANPNPMSDSAIQYISTPRLATPISISTK